MSACIELCNEISISLKVVSSTDWFVVGKAAIEISLAVLAGEGVCEKLTLVCWLSSAFSLGLDFTGLLEAEEAGEQECALTVGSAGPALEPIVSPFLPVTLLCFL